MKIIDNGLAKQYFSLLNRTGGKPSGPEDKFGLSLSIAETTLVSVQETVSRVELTTVGQDGMLLSYRPNI